MFQPVFARGEFTLNLEYDGAGVNVGARHTANSGLQVALGVETVNKPNEIQYHLAISWTNAKIIEQIASANRLAREAAKLASQTKANKQ